MRLGGAAVRGFEGWIAALEEDRRRADRPLVGPLPRHDGRAFAGGDIVILRVANADATFMGYYCNTAPINAQKASMGQGDAVVHISAAALSRIEVTVPAAPEQTAIAAVLSDMDAELAALEARRDKTRALKQAMMQELLTGKTRLVAVGCAHA